MDKIPRFTISKLCRFEEVMKKAEMTEDKWPMQLETRKALEALAQHIPVEAKNEY